jgi:hypothetical protein
MYKILGGDGKEYGPIAVDTLRQWIAEGRANAQTQVFPEGGASWVALGTLPEFAPSFAAPLTPGPAPVDASRAAQMINGPAIGLIVTASLGALAQVLSAVVNILQLTGTMASPMGQGQNEMPAWMGMMSGGLGLVFNAIGLITAVLVFMGATKMRKLESYNFAMAATIIAMVPCISPCCYVGLPIGIWALVQLMKPEVKAAFKA